jgi:aryl-alcohol dehydrogenase-like predicted oxidoreductase
MKHRKIGNSDLNVSVVGLGCNNFGMMTDLEESRAVIETALEKGVTLFDTADIYGNRGGSETILGRVLGDRRKDIVLATKFGKPMDDAGTKKGASRRYILSAIEASLKRLKTDWIDLYQIHEPDPGTPLDETLKTLDDLVREGKVRYAGCSNFPASKVVESCRVSRELGTGGFVSCQDHYSLLARSIEQELIPAMESHDLGLIPFFPLAGGMLTGKYRRDRPAGEGTRFAAWQDLAKRYTTERNWDVIGSLEKFCAARNHSLLELAFCWLLARPMVSSVIAGATKPEQVAKNVAASDDWPLSREDLEEIDRFTRPSSFN